MPDTTSPQRLYEADAVDAYIGELRAQIECLQLRLREREAPVPAPDSEVVAAQARATAIVGEARTEAEEVLRARRRDADELIDSASRRADAIRREAEDYAAVSRSAAEADAAATLEHARHEAERIVEEATVRADALRAEAEAAAEDRIRTTTVGRSAESDRLIVDQIEASHRRLLEMFSAIVESVRTTPVPVAAEPAVFAPAPLLDLPRWDAPRPAGGIARLHDDETHDAWPEVASSPVAEPLPAEPFAGEPVDLTALEPDDRRFFAELRASLRSGGTPALGHDPDGVRFAVSGAVAPASPAEPAKAADLSTLPPPDPSALVEPYEDDEPGRNGTARWARRSRA